MDVRFLQTFVHVVELGSIAEAARFEGLTPASVQQRLRALDASIGSRLLQRAGRTVQPTVAGRRILEQAQRILRDIRDLRSLASDTTLPAGPLTLGATPTALTGMVPGALKRWFERYPDIEIFIEPGTSKTLYGRVLEAALDAAIVVQPFYEVPKHVRKQDIRQEPLMLITPYDLEVEDPLQALKQHPYICYDRSVLGGKLADDYLHTHGIRPRIRLELDGIDAIGNLVSEGLGVSLLPDTGTLKEGPGGVAKWALPGEAPQRTVALFWGRSGVRAPLAEAFWEALQN